MAIAGAPPAGYACRCLGFPHPVKWRWHIYFSSSQETGTGFFVVYRDNKAHKMHKNQ